jgi:tetratricopeptide (TPR) repeat protein
LQTAIKAKDSAAIPGLVAAASALAKTPDDRYAIASLQLQVAAETDDNAALVAAADAMRANGAPSDTLVKVYLHAGQAFGNSKQFPLATAALDKALAIEPNNIDALLLKSDLSFKQGNSAASVAALNLAIARNKATGQAIPESWYQAAVARSYDAKLPGTYDAARQWVTAYPTQQHWRDAINIYRNMSGLDRPGLIDIFRLARVTHALTGESDYLAASDTLTARGLPGEAIALLDEGAAAKSISLSSVTFARPYALAKGKSIGDRAAANAAVKTALVAPAAATTMGAADRLLGYGDFAQAATLYRAALGKTGANSDLINLRLGEALAQSGDKAGATAALQAVGPSQSEVAKYWLAWVATR